MLEVTEKIWRRSAVPLWVGGFDEFQVLLRELLIAQLDYAAKQLALEPSIVDNQLGESLRHADLIHERPEDIARCNVVGSP